MSDLIPSLAYTALLDLHPTYRSWDVDAVLTKEILIDLTHAMTEAHKRLHSNLHELAAEWIAQHFTAQAPAMVARALIDARSSQLYMRTRTFDPAAYQKLARQIDDLTQVLLITGRHDLLQHALDVARLDDQFVNNPSSTPSHRKAHLPERRTAARRRLGHALRAAEVGAEIGSSS